MTTIHIMLDLKTWGNTPGSDIRSIGACVFDPQRSTVGGGPSGIDHFSIDMDQTFYIATDNPNVATYGPHDPKYPLTRDPQTVQWWNDQSAEAQAAFTDPVDLREALIKFGAWLHMLDGGSYVMTHHSYKPCATVRLWSHGAHYDGPILAAAYAAVGLPVPWHYRAPRDTRTIFDAAGIDPERWYEAIETTGTLHNALDDAINQARAVCLAFERIAAPRKAMSEIANLGSCAHGKRRVGDLFQNAIDIAMRYV